MMMETVVGMMGHSYDDGNSSRNDGGTAMMMETGSRNDGKE
jgi:hypothetical protein